MVLKKRWKREDGLWGRPMDDIETETKERIQEFTRRQNLSTFQRLREDLTHYFSSRSQETITTT